MPTPVKLAFLGGIAAGTAIDRAGHNPLRFLGDALGPDPRQHSSERLNLDAEIQQGARQKLQPAPGSTVPTLTAGTSDFNRRAEANRMRQQGGGGSTQSRPTAAQPTSRSAHAGGWTPEMRGAAYAAGKAMEDDRLSNQAAGLPALWGDVRPDSDPRSESYWQRADMQQWASANLELANRSRSRYNLPPLERGADGKVIVSGGTVSPYAKGFFERPMNIPIEKTYGGDLSLSLPSDWSTGLENPSIDKSFRERPMNIPIEKTYGGDLSLSLPSDWSTGLENPSPAGEFLKRFRAQAK